MDAHQTFYITTPIYYPSGKLHIGHAYTTVAADALARWHRSAGKDVLFLTGSDEHGQKIERKAKEKGVEPQQYVDEIVTGFQDLWRRLNVSYDDFVRTTEPRHARVVQHIFQTIYEKGDIYKDEYEGWYCTPCESFWVETKLGEGRVCPDCGRPVELVKEESYFFRISRYADRLLKHIEENPDFIQPESRRNEMVSFIKSGLEDLCVSRTTFSWGIPVPINTKHVIYVWFDALSNYLTGCGYLQDEEKFNKYWPADVHLVGKEIVRFHTIIWPIILMALDLPLPKQVFGHGWLLFDNDKMSKSKGNVVDPIVLIDRFGVDAIRYFLLREISFGQDGSFSVRALVERINSDLANDLGNLLHRTSAMIGKFAGGVVPAPREAAAVDEDLTGLARQTVHEVTNLMDKLQINTALATIWRFVGRVNKYIDETEPWALNKDVAKHGRRDTVLYNFAESLRVIALLIKPFMPGTAARIWEQIGLSDVEKFGLTHTEWGGLKPGVDIRPGEPLFPRLEVDEVVEELTGKAGLKDKSEGATAGQIEKAEAAPAEAPQKAAPQEKASEKEYISIDDFAKVELKVAEVLKAERIPGADRLLKLQIDVGGEKRQLVAGIAQYYEPEALVGKKVIIVSNLKPAKLRGELSEGMILAASTDDKKSLGILTVDRDVPSGCRVR